MEKFTLDCPKCGGSLDISFGVDLFRCSYCGTPTKLIKNGSTISLAILEEKVTEISKDLFWIKKKEQETKLSKAERNLFKIEMEKYSILSQKAETFKHVPKIFKNARVYWENYYGDKIESNNFAYTSAKAKFQEQVKDYIKFLIDYMQNFSEMTYSNMSDLISKIDILCERADLMDSAGNKRYKTDTTEALNQNGLLKSPTMLINVLQNVICNKYLSQ